MGKLRALSGDPNIAFIVTSLYAGACANGSSADCLIPRESEFGRGEQREDSKEEVIVLTKAFK